MIGITDEHQVHAFGKHAAVALEVVEQLRAALVLVDPARRKSRSGRARRTFAENARRWLCAGISEPTPTTTPGTSALPAIAWISARSSNELYMNARTPRKNGREDRQAERAVAFGGGHRIALSGHRARAVIRVVIADAEKDEEVERRCVLPDVVDQLRARGPSASSQASSSRRACAPGKHTIREPAELRRVALARHRETAAP